MKLFLTSFDRWHKNVTPNNWAAYSVAVYQPHWFSQLPKINGFDIRENGRWIRPRDFIGEDHVYERRQSVLSAYADKLMSVYDSRENEIWNQLQNLEYYNEHEVTALCCWCPYDKAARRQLDDFGSFICHTVAIEAWFQARGVEVVRDKDRREMVYL